MIIVFIHILYVSFMPVLRPFTSDRMGCQLLKYTSDLCQFMWVGRDVQLDNILCFRLRYICLTVENFCKIIVIIISFFQTLKMNLLGKMTNIYEK